MRLPASSFVVRRSLFVAAFGGRRIVETDGRQHRTLEDSPIGVGRHVWPRSWRSKKRSTDPRWRRQQQSTALPWEGQCAQNRLIRLRVLMIASPRLAGVFSFARTASLLEIRLADSVLRPMSPGMGPSPSNPTSSTSPNHSLRNRVRTYGGVAPGCVATESSSVPVAWSGVAGQRGSVGSSGVDCSGKSSSERWLRTRSLRLARMSSSLAVNKLMKC
jgi:hypothetical protein